MRRLIVLWLVALASPAWGQAPAGDWILAKVDENLGSRTKLSRTRMTIAGLGGSRTVESRSWIRGTRESFTEYLAPPRDKGTKMLKLGEQLWTFFPSTDRTILIAGHMLRQSVMGSDLSYEDLMEDPRLPELYEAAVIREEAHRSRPCWVLRLTGRQPGLAYQVRQMWVDQERFVPLREERFAKSGKLLKTSDVVEVAQVGRRWIARRIDFKDVLKTGSGTTFEIESIEFDVEIPPHLLSKAALRR